MSQLMASSWQRHCQSVEPSCGLPRGGLLDQRGPPGLRTMTHLRPMKPSLTRAYMNPVRSCERSRVALDAL
jgi:hypothetical protein